MTAYFISRHPGALAWAAEEGVTVDRQVAHLDAEIVRPGDVVIGTLPVNLAARVCERGGRYLHLSLELPPEWRGENCPPPICARSARICESIAFCRSVRISPVSG